MSALARQSQSPQRQPLENLVSASNESERDAKPPSTGSMISPSKTPPETELQGTDTAAEVTSPCTIKTEAAAAVVGATSPLSSLKKDRANSDACVPDDLKALTSSLFALLDDETAPLGLEGGDKKQDDKTDEVGCADQEAAEGKRVEEAVSKAGLQACPVLEADTKDNQQSKTVPAKKERVAQALKSRKESAARAFTKGREQASIALQRKKEQAASLKQKSVEQAASLKQKMLLMRGQKEKPQQEIIEPEFCIADDDEDKDEEAEEVEGATSSTTSSTSPSASPSASDERNTRTRTFVLRSSTGSTALKQKREQVALALQRKKQQASQMKQKLRGMGSGLTRFGRSRSKGKATEGDDEIEVEVDLGTYGAF
jgi:hypothetical protein